MWKELLGHLQLSGSEKDGKVVNIYGMITLQGQNVCLQNWWLFIKPTEHHSNLFFTAMLFGSTC
jgi:hypothetical protein